MSSGGQASVLRAQIGVINTLLANGQPGDPEYFNWINRLQHMQRELAELEMGEQWSAADSTQPSTYTNNYHSTSSDSLGFQSRKRNLGLVADDGPQPKRVSANLGPSTPSTPESLQGVPQPQQLLPSLPNRAMEAAGGAATFIDLTISDPPSPVGLSGPVNGSCHDHSTPERAYGYQTDIGRPGPAPKLEHAFRNYQAQPAATFNQGFMGRDPFPELEHAFNGNGATPADAFTQEFMRPDELAQFLIAPRTQNQPLTPSMKGDGSMTPLGSMQRPVPYLPSPQRPEWLGQDSDDNADYGDILLTAGEAESIEQMLEIVEQNNQNTQEDREETPRIMASTLKEYQKIGLSWLIKMEDGRNKGGILADEMGLGKTVQALALICARPSQDLLIKTTLIIAPVALLRQWEKEIARHVQNRHKLSVYIYWGAGKKADFATLRRYDVVLTTYGTLSSEFKQRESRRETMLYEREQRDPTFRRKPREKLALLGYECMWYRIVLDEAHTIKNRNSIQSKATVDLQARHRLCLTGTPMMNSIDELYPLLRFMRVSRYNDWKLYNMEIAKPVKHTNQETRNRAMKRVQILLKAVLFRRLKSSEVDGKPILNLPAKHTNVDHTEFSDDEHELYKALETKSQIQFNKYLKTNSVTANYACILVLLLRLRQACCHPHLIKDLSQPATEGIAEDDLLERARHLTEDVVKRLQEVEYFECPICLEADPNPTIIVPCGHTVCGACVQKIIENAKRDQDGTGVTKARCPHCRGELKAELITDYKHFCRVFCPERLEPSDRIEAENSESDDDETADEDEYDIDDKGNLAGFVVSDEDIDEDPSGSGFQSEGHFKSEGDSMPEQSRSKASNHNATKKSKSKGKGPALPRKSLAQLKKESLRSKAAKKKYLRRLDKTWIPSAKTLEVIELLTKIRKNDPTEKTLVFSQFTSLLDLVEVPMVQNKFKYQRYDGSMSMQERTDAVEAFMEDPEQNIMLVSLKAGNAGLNLWRASQVVMLDPFWNPFVEEQAVDRAHRMPQEREVHVHRILIPETVEDRICALQDKKREVIGAALDENASKEFARLNVRELKFLFGVG
ncbi:SNF2 family N-terminal domain-containing protein [Phaeosphaeria sp. MPI-PUGE-AT-0046c]|nr:SNF2 family N-terminal domain-containing protein [Phaeosphaeria sp. MPI-PUGE-AT-0046c]